MSSLKTESKLNSVICASFDMDFWGKICVSANSLTYFVMTVFFLRKIWRIIFLYKKTQMNLSPELSIIWYLLKPDWSRNIPVDHVIRLALFRFDVDLNIFEILFFFAHIIRPDFLILFNIFFARITVRIPPRKFRGSLTHWNPKKYLKALKGTFFVKLLLYSNI